MLKDRAALLFHLEYLGIPHARTIRELIARYGVQRSRYFDWHVVRIDGARPLVAHQVDAFCVELATSLEPDLLPPSAFHAYASVGKDARENHAATLAALSPLLGAPRETSASNTIAHEWSLDTAVIAISVFPPELQSPQLRNPAQERHPELRTHCGISLRPGHVILPTAEELAWMRDAEPIVSSLPPQATLWVDSHDVTRGSHRPVPEDLRRDGIFIAATHAVVGMRGSVGFVVELSDVMGVRLTRLAPARGGGGALLDLAFADRSASDRKLRQRSLYQSSTEDGLDRLARDIAARLGTTLTIEQGFDD